MSPDKKGYPKVVVDCTSWNRGLGGGNDSTNENSGQDREGGIFGGQSIQNESESSKRKIHQGVGKKIPDDRKLLLDSLISEK